MVSGEDIGSLRECTALPLRGNRDAGVATSEFAQSGNQGETCNASAFTALTIVRRSSTPIASGGMMAITKEMQGVPPHWMVYYGVADVDATVAKAQSLGGSLVMPAWDAKGVGRIAILKDPTGAKFSVIKGDPEQK